MGPWYPNWGPKTRVTWRGLGGIQRMGKGLEGDLPPGPSLAPRPKEGEPPALASDGSAKWEGPSREGWGNPRLKCPPLSFSFGFAGPVGGFSQGLGDGFSHCLFYRIVVQERAVPHLSCGERLRQVLHQDLELLLVRVTIQAADIPREGPEDPRVTANPGAGIHFVPIVPPLKPRNVLPIVFTEVKTKPKEPLPSPPCINKRLVLVGAART